MRFSSYINNAKCLEWGLNANQGALFDLLNQASSWAHEVVINGVVYYWVSRNEVISELPLFYSKPDTVYRHFVELDRKDLIDYLKVDGKDLIRLTPKGKTWNEFNSEINPKTSDLNPNNSEIDPKNSDLNPTNNITNNNIKKDLTNVKSKKNPQKPAALENLEPCFEKFWSAGMVKINKSKALKSFKANYESFAAEHAMSLEEFTEMLVEDVQERLRLRQFGFDKLHPTTYLNNWRWRDDYPPLEPVVSQSKPKFSDENTTWWKGRFIEIYGDTL
ncbi:hypothetical protein JFL47_09430 [Haemophilus haemoglobinophilus]|nr:hypothetical protein [Canicola haemoglobinophilus]